MLYESNQWPYASAHVLALEALAILRPPKRYTVDAYALEHRRLKNPGGGYIGPWQHEKVPYMVEPMRCLTSRKYQTIAIAAPGQSAKTSVGENWLLHAVACDPANFLWYMQTEPTLESYVKNYINTMIDDHAVLSRAQGERQVDDSLHFKNFRTMTVEFLSATYNNLISKRAPRIIADEIDAYPDNIGDVKALLDIRRQTFGDESKILAISHPDKARGIDPAKDWNAGIMAIYADSDRRVWYWPCPHCGAWSSPVPTAPRHMVLSYAEDGTLDEIEDSAHLLCPVNGCIIADAHRYSMNLKGCWVAEGESIAEDGTVSGEPVKRRTAGFWVVGVMSPFIMGGIGGLARARVKAERERDISGDDLTLRQVIIKQWGVPYNANRSVGSFDANELAERCEPGLALGKVPQGCRFLTAMVDVQAWGFEYLVRGWGIACESWVIDRGRILADPATNPDDWDKLLTEVFQKKYPLDDATGRVMTIRASGYDSAGAPGVATQAYATWTRWKLQRAIRLYGQINGRDAWSIIPTKGSSTPKAPKLVVSYPDTTRAANKVAGRGAVPIAAFNPNSFKDDLAGQLSRLDAGPNCVHFPHDLRNAEAPHVWFEQLTAEQRDVKGRWNKSNAAARNEALDVMVGCDVIAHLHGLRRIDWENPPPWAAPWDQNSLVEKPEVQQTTAAPALKNQSIISRLA